MTHEEYKNCIKEIETSLESLYDLRMDLINLMSENNRIVYCSDCKFWDCKVNSVSGNIERFCKKHLCIMGGHDFCSKGER